MKGEKGSLNTSNENVRTDVEHTLEESSDSNAQTIQFQVPGMCVFDMCFAFS